MPSNSSPVCFRLGTEERKLMEAVARFQGESLSAFVRGAAIATANAIVRKHGPEAILAVARTSAAHSAEEARAQVEDLEQLFTSNPTAEPGGRPGGRSRTSGH